MADETAAGFSQGKLKVRLVTPERILIDTDASSVTLPGTAGVLEALPGAAPLLTAIGAGDLIIGGAQGGDQRFIVARGFAEVLPDRVTVLAEYAVKPEEVDKGAAEQQLKDGQKLESDAGDDPRKYAAARETVLEAEAKLGTPGQ
ncbi:ATP synthase F1 subunit epsilon [Acidipila sp. EB88]|uniref:ATP synthase F1 subunit epsilon n=1 Tax=Acidipila sp. EB88 TaxID=2305226 RepID=UPI000F5F94C4|nr:ATP synthase F1 subunit epsilon [Acidipila sp. EB88]RRA48576.1 ATP synthase F1 subunit epsilon [Acidipila sp. EB88]